MKNIKETIISITICLMLAGLIMFLVSILSGCEMYKYREYAWDSVRNKSYLKYDISIDKAMVNTNKTGLNFSLPNGLTIDVGESITEDSPESAAAIGGAIGEAGKVLINP